MPFALGDKTPQIDPEAFIANGAVVIGDVALGASSSIWYGTVVRGDVEAIRIGTSTNIQDNSVVHVTGGRYATTIGDRITIGHRVIIHGATLMSDSFIGMGAMIMDGATIEPFGFVAAGALVPPGMVVKSGWLALGAPAKLIREIKPEEREMMQRTWQGYVKHALWHKNNLRELK